MDCASYMIPEVALLLYNHEAHLSHPVRDISAVEMDAGRDPGVSDVEAQDGERSHETAEDDSRLCAA